jgi:predicted ABC-type ATPase
LLFVSTSHPSINGSRITHSVLEGGHYVSIPKIISRCTKSIFNCCVAALRSDRLYVYDNAEDFAEAKLLFRASDGKLKKNNLQLMIGQKKFLRL